MEDEHKPNEGEGGRGVGGMEEEEEVAFPPLVHFSLVGGGNSWNSPLFGADRKTL